jgi:hypothetical protein
MTKLRSLATSAPAFALSARATPASKAMDRRRISAIALAAVAAFALTAEMAMAEQRRVGQYLSWQQMGNTPGLNDLPSALDDMPPPPTLARPRKDPQPALNGHANLTLNGTALPSAPDSAAPRGRPPMLTMTWGGTTVFRKPATPAGMKSLKSK